MASSRPRRPSASNLIAGAGSIASTFAIDAKAQKDNPEPTKVLAPRSKVTPQVRHVTELHAVTSPEPGKSVVHSANRTVAKAPVSAARRVEEAPATPSTTHQPAHRLGNLDDAREVRRSSAVRIPNTAAQVPEGRSVTSVSVPDPEVTATSKTSIRDFSAERDSQIGSPNVGGSSAPIAPRPPAVRKPLVAPVAAAPRLRSPMSTYSQLTRRIDKSIAETDLVREDGRGVFDDYTTNMTRLRYEQGVTYNDLLPLTFPTGFNSGLERATFRFTQHQVEEAKKYSNYLSREIKLSGGGEQKVVRSPSVSLLHRIMQDFFIANAPQDCFDGVTDEHSARATVGLQPLPELEIFEYTMAAHDPSTGPFPTRISTTDLVRPDGEGVFDDYRTNMSKFQYERGVQYNDLLPITFPSGFNSGLERVTVQMTRSQVEESKKYSNYLTREIKNNVAGEQRMVRSSAVSMLHRIMQDFFIANAPRDCFDGVAGEQEARASVGLPPLPELEIFEYEIHKRMRQMLED